MSLSCIRMAILLCAVAFTSSPAVLAQAKEGGELPGPGDVNVFNPLEGRNTVLSGKPEGSLVKKGEVVCELDASPLKERLANQEIIIQGAASGHEGARLASQVAEIAALEYEGIHEQEMQTALGEIALSESDRKRAEDRLDWCDRMLKNGRVSVAQNLADKLDLQRATFAYEQAQTKKVVLEKYTKPKTVSELKSQVEKAKARELTERAAYEREQATRKRLMRQIDQCKVIAPADGRVTYMRPFGSGAVVRDGEVLFRLIPVNAAGPRTK